jgi:hypothetical protein
MDIASSPVRFESWLISHCSLKLVYNRSEFWWVNYFEHYMQPQSIHESYSFLNNYWGTLEFYFGSSCQLLWLKTFIFFCLYFDKFWVCTHKRSTWTRWFLDHGFFYPEDGGDAFLRNSVHTRSTQPHVPEDSILNMWYVQSSHKILTNTDFNVLYFTKDSYET